MPRCRAGSERGAEVGAAWAGANIYMHAHCLGYCGKVIGRESSVRLQPGMRLHASVAHGRGGAAWWGVRRGVADLRCDVGGLLQELDDVRVLTLLGVVQRRRAVLRRGGGEGGGGGGRPGGRGQRAGRRGEAARRLRRAPPPHPRPAPSPRPHPRLPPRPSAPSLTLSLRLASAPALSSDSTQEARPRAAARCSAVYLFCRDAAAAPHTRG